ncbi:hypothetical protein [Acinetobacter pittii]|nr:hypothetical protein [Acinetobacter pittii]
MNALLLPLSFTNAYAFQLEYELQPMHLSLHAIGYWLLAIGYWLLAIKAQ